MNNNIIASLMFFLIVLSSIACGEETTSNNTDKTFKSTQNVTILSKQYLLIDLAVEEFLKHEVSLDEYLIVLLKKGGGHVVIFTDPEITIYHTGSTKRMRTFEVAFDSFGEITKATFVR